MRALLDNDILKKLARYGLLNQLKSVLSAIGVDGQYCKLPAAQYVLRTLKPDATRWPIDAQRQSLHTFLENDCESIAGGDYDAIAALNVPQLDAGEIQLVASAIETSDSVLLTSDKRALRALGCDPLLAGYAESMSGRIIHLETLMYRFNRDFGWSFVAASVRSAPDADTGLKFVYREPAEDTGTELLLGSIRQLRHETGSILRDPL